MVNVALSLRTVDPDPVDVVVPVPPFKTGNGVPEYVIANVPVVVTGDPVVFKNEGVVKPTEETDPPPKEPIVVHAS